jgi:hypothetical protein
MSLQTLRYGCRQQDHHDRHQGSAIFRSSQVS